MHRSLSVFQREERVRLSVTVVDGRLPDAVKYLGTFLGRSQHRRRLACRPGPSRADQHLPTSEMQLRHRVFKYLDGFLRSMFGVVESL